MQHPKFFSGGFFSHEGPSEKVNENLDFSITFVGKGWPKADSVSEPTDQFPDAPKKTIVTKVSGTDPGYGATTNLLLTAGLTILEEADKMPET